MMNKFYRISFLLGLLLSLSPLLTGMYAPALPELQKHFSTNVFYIQLTISLSVIGLAVGQLVLGVISDRYCRKNTLILSLLCFGILSFLCTCKISLYYFLIIRFLQGFFAAGGVISARSLARVYFDQTQLLKGISIITFVSSLSKIVYPILGGRLLLEFTWKSIFYFITLLTLFLCLFSFCLPKVMPVAKNKKIIKPALKMLLHNKIFIVSLILFTLIQIMQFSYVSSVSFIFQNVYGFSTYQFSLIFSMSACCFALGTLGPTKLSSQNWKKLTPWGIFLSASLMYICVHFFNQPYWFILCLMIFRFFMGLAYTVYMFSAMSINKKYAGTASALLGVCAYLFAAIISPITSLGNMLNMMVCICCILSLFVVYISNKYIKDTE